MGNPIIGRYRMLLSQVLIRRSPEGDRKIYGEKGAAQAGDTLSEAGMAARIAKAVGERAKIARPALDPKLLDKLTDAGVTFNRADTIWIAEYAKPGVPLAWPEKGNVNAGLILNAGLIHIISRHSGEYATAGVRIEDILALVKTALTEGTRVGTQGTGRPIYEVVFQGKTLRLAIGVDDSGSVIGANPV